MTDKVIRLKQLLRIKRWSSYGTFRREYDRAAALVDRSLMGTAPSRAQLHRWTSGELRSLPHPHHCQVLERMFSEWTADQLFELVTDESPTKPGLVIRANEATSSAAALVSPVASSLADTETPGTIAWGPSTRSPQALARPQGLSLGAFGCGEQSDSESLGRALLRLGQVLRLSDEDIEQLSALSGQVIDLSLRVDLDIAADGSVELCYRYHLLNMTGQPFTRLPRELWFQYTDGELAITPVQDGDHRVAIKRIHNAGTLAKFACLVSPAVTPGQDVHIGYRCTGGVFRESRYWRQEIPRFTRQYTLNVRHRKAGLLAECVATEEHPDGAENTAQAGLTWDYDGKDVLMTATFDYLRPNQAVTLRWELAE